MTSQQLQCSQRSDLPAWFITTSTTFVAWAWQFLFFCGLLPSQFSNLFRIPARQSLRCFLLFGFCAFDKIIWKFHHFNIAAHMYDISACKYPWIFVRYHQWVWSEVFVSHVLKFTFVYPLFFLSSELYFLSNVTTKYYNVAFARGVEYMQILNSITSVIASVAFIGVWDQGILLRMNFFLEKYKYLAT